MKWVKQLMMCLTIAAASAQEPEPSTARSTVVQPTTVNETKSAESIDSRSQPRTATARADRLDLDTTVVTGNRELPKVLYIVPWKKAELGELPAQPFNTLLDELLMPVDREVFKREVKYYEAITRANGAAVQRDSSSVDDRGRSAHD